MPSPLNVTRSIGNTWSGKAFVKNASGYIIDYAKLTTKTATADKPNMVTLTNNGDGTFELRDKGITGLVVVTITLNGIPFVINMTWTADPNSLVAASVDIVEN